MINDHLKEIAKKMTIQELLETKNIQFDTTAGGLQLWINCPSCKSQKKKLTISTAGKGYYCHRCGLNGGPKGLAELLGDNDIKFEVADEKDEPDLPPIDPQIIKANQNRLKENSCSDVRQYLYERGLNDETIEKFKLGWDGRNVVIPVFDGNGDCVNFRLRSDPTRPNSKSALFSIPGRGRHRLFNEAILKTKPKDINICEGEWDCMFLSQYGYSAVTSTGGCASFKKEWTPYFKGIDRIAICFDNDKGKNWNNPGQESAKKLVEEFKKQGKNVVNIKLPDPGPNYDKTDITDYFVREKHTKDDFEKLLSTWTENRDGTYTFEEIKKIVEDFLPNSSEALRLILAVAVSSQYDDFLMLWLLLVGVPSSGKTELALSITKSVLAHRLDNLTQNAFISGERETEKQKVHDLLPLLNKKCLVIKDWTSIFSLDEKMTKKLLGDLVNIYDKEFVKFSSRRGNIGYESFFSQIGCITPATLNKHTGYLNMVGPRFLAYTMKPSSEEDKKKSYESIFKGIDRKQQEKKVRAAVSAYLTQLSKKQFVIKPLSEAAQEFLRCSAELMANCRGIVIMQPAAFFDEKEKKEVKYYEVLEIQIEDPWRAVQQLMYLALFLSFVVGKEEVDAEELAIIKEVVISSMPADRSQALRAIKDNGGEISAKELSDVSEKSKKTSTRLLDELVALKVLDKEKGYASMPNKYRVKSVFKNYLTVYSAEFMSTWTESRGGIPKTTHSTISSKVSATSNNIKPNLRRSTALVSSETVEDPYKDIPGYWDTVPKDQWPQWKLDQEASASSG